MTAMRDDPEAVQARGGPGDAAAPPSRRPSRWPSPMAAPAVSSNSGEQRDDPPVLRPRVGRQLHGQGGGQDDRGRVVEARLGLEHPGQPPGQRHRAQHREHRRGVGRGQNRADEQGHLPRQVEQLLGEEPDDGDRHDAPRPSTGRRPGATTSRMPDHRVVSPPSARMRMSARVAQHLGEVDVAEVDAQAALADGEAEAEVEQQGRQTGPGRDPHRDEGEQHDDGAEQQHPGQLRQAERLVRARPGQRHGAPPLRDEARSGMPGAHLRGRPRRGCHGAPRIVS